MLNALGVWQGKLFFAPGLQGSLEKQEVEKRRTDPEAAADYEHNPYGLAFHATQDGDHVQRKAQSDGTYAKAKPDQSKSA